MDRDNLIGKLNIRVKTIIQKSGVLKKEVLKSRKKEGKWVMSSVLWNTFN